MEVSLDILGGLEGAVHLFSNLIEAYGTDPSLCFLKLDMSNAFNNCHRDCFLLHGNRTTKSICLGAVVHYHAAGDYV